MAVGRKVSIHFSSIRLVSPNALSVINDFPLPLQTTAEMHWDYNWAWAPHPISHVMLWPNLLTITIWFLSKSLKSDFLIPNCLPSWRGLENANCILCRRKDLLHTHSKGYPMYNSKLNPVLRFQFRRSGEYSFIVITPRFHLTRSGSIC